MNAATRTGSEASERAVTQPVLLIASLHARAGKTAVAAALALKLAYEGRRLLALRLAGDEQDAPSARADAAVFHSLPFARGRGGVPVEVDEVQRASGDQAANGGLLVLEAPAGGDIAAIAQQVNAAVLLVVRAADSETLQALSTLAIGLGDRLIGAVALAAPAALTEQARQALAAGPVPILGVVPEDATLYAPSTLEIADALDAEVILGEPDESQIIEHLMIGPITTDPGQPYYARPRSRRAVITRSDKTDLQLAAMHTDIDCLILTGGYPPSPYTIDRAADNEISVLLAKPDTLGTVRLLEEIYTTTRFAGEEKLERMGALIDQHLDLAPLRRAIGAA